MSNLPWREHWRESQSKWTLWDVAIFHVSNLGLSLHFSSLSTSLYDILFLFFIFLSIIVLEKKRNNTTLIYFPLSAWNVVIFFHFYALNGVTGLFMIWRFFLWECECTVFFYTELDRGTGRIAFHIFLLFIYLDNVIFHYYICIIFNSLYFFKLALFTLLCLRFMTSSVI